MVRSSEFEFWEEKVPEGSTSCSVSGGNSMEFQIGRHVEDQFTVYTPPWWKQAPINNRPETSPLLSRNCHDRCLSPTSRRRAILDGRRELMEMINDMPETSFELSLKDIVDDLQNDGEKPEMGAQIEKKVQPERRRIPQKSQNTKSGDKKISRTESMESEVFLLKMFFPLSLSSKRKSTATRRSKICPVPSSDESKKRATRDWWKTMFLSIKDNRKTTTISRSKSDVSNYRTSTIENTLLPCQRSLSEKCTSRGRGCLF